MKENFTAKSKPFAKVLSNKKSWLRKEICLTGQLARQTAELCCLPTFLAG
jgi:hypothetical protein